MSRILVTGAAGFIGSHLVQALAKQGDEVIGIDNFDPFYPRAMKERNLEEIGAKPGFTFRELDLLDVPALISLLTPETVLVHLAAKAGVRPSLADPVGYARVNVTGRNLYTWSNYLKVGYDPEVQQVARSLAAEMTWELWAYPPSRSFYFTIDLGF